MTTITWDLQTLATDSRCSIGPEIYDEHCKKLFKSVGIFSAVAASGSPDDAEHFIFSALAGVLDLEELLAMDVPKGIDMVAVLGKTCWMINCAGVSRLNKPWALGTGGEYALAAMDLGKTAVEAVKYASTRDLYTNSRVQKFTVKGGDT